MAACLHAAERAPFEALEVGVPVSVPMTLELRCRTFPPDRRKATAAEKARTT
jgi:hypothetical protein